MAPTSYNITFHETKESGGDASIISRRMSHYLGTATFKRHRESEQKYCDTRKRRVIPNLE